MSTLNVSYSLANRSNLLSMESKNSIKFALSLDIRKYKNEHHREKSETAFVKYLSAKTGISTPQLIGAKDGKTLPIATNIIKIYSAIHDTKDVGALKNKMSPVLKKYIEELEINNDKINKAILIHDSKFNSVILNNEIRKGIYFLSSGYGCSIDFIKEEYGNKGLEEVKALVAIDVIRVADGKVTRGSVYLQKNINDNNDFISTLFKNHGPKEDNESHWHQAYAMGNISFEATEKIKKELDRASKEVNSIIKEDNLTFKDKPEFQTEKYFYAMALSIVE